MRRSRSFRSALVVLLLPLVAALTLVAPSTAQAEPHARTAAGRYETTAFQATNQRRASHHRARLRANACLHRFAKRQAVRMARRNRLVHQGLAPIQRRCHVGWVGENIAVGYPTGRAVVTAWMHSTGHRENILRRQYRLMGIGAVKRGGRWWVSQVFGRRA